MKARLDAAPHGIDAPSVQDAIESALLAAYVDAITSGAQDALTRLDENRAFDAMASTTYRTLKSLAPDIARTSTQRLADEVRQTLAEGVSRGESASELAQRVRDAFDATQVDAMRIARTEAMRAYNRGGLEAAREAGATRWVFRAHPDADNGDPNGICNQLDGQEFSIDDVGMVPPDSTHPNCTCWQEYLPPDEATQVE